MSSITLQEEIIFAPLLYVKIRESERSYEQIYTHVCARMILGFDTHTHHEYIHICVWWFPRIQHYVYVHVYEHIQGKMESGHFDKSCFSIDAL